MAAGPASVDAVFSPVVATPPAVVEALVAEVFGLDGVATRLVAERDENFLLEGRDGLRHLVKVTNPAEDRAVTRYHTSAYLHLAVADPTLPVPHLLPSRDGGHEAVLDGDGGAARVVRVLSFLPGVGLHRAQSSPGLRAALGTVLARLDRALASFAAPPPAHALAWDLQRAAELRPLLDVLDGDERRPLALRALDAFEDHAQPRLRAWPRQAIHNDFQPYNVLVDAAEATRVTGVIDFGDMVVAPRVCELAVAAAYQLAAPDPLGALADFVGAYAREWPLPPEALDVLPTLIATRLTMTVTITRWRAAREPANRDYILRNAPAAWRGLEALAGCPPAALRGRLQAALAAGDGA